MANRFKKIIEETPEAEPEVIQPEEEQPKEEPQKRKPMNSHVKNVASGYREFFGGDFLTKEVVLKQLPFFFLLFLLVVAYIYNNNLAEKNLMKIERTKKELIELRYEYISSKADMMDSLKQSMVQKKLEALGIKEPTNPPHKIYINTTKEEKK